MSKPTMKPFNVTEFVKSMSVNAPFIDEPLPDDVTMADFIKKFGERSDQLYAEQTLRGVDLAQKPESAAGGVSYTFTLSERQLQQMKGMIFAEVTRCSTDEMLKYLANPAGAFMKDILAGIDKEDIRRRVEERLVEVLIKQETMEDEGA